MAAGAASTPVISDSSQVDLSTIPISPDGANGHDENKDSNGSPSEEQITVFHDPDNFNVKHPLMNKWTLWFTKPPSGKASLRQQHFTFNMLTSRLGRQLERSVEGSYHL
jgi:translation initiation factor 4E